MSEPSQAPLTCPNGHLSPGADARFCIVCGAGVGVVFQQPHGRRPAVPPPPQMPVDYNRPPQQAPTPVFDPHGYPQQATPYAPTAPTPDAEQCRRCGGDGRRLDGQTVICKECAWLRPMA
jgi:hypothetical protein